MEYILPPPFGSARERLHAFTRLDAVAIFLLGVLRGEYVHVPGAQDCRLCYKDSLAHYSTAPMPKTLRRQCIRALAMVVVEEFESNYANCGDCTDCANCNNCSNCANCGGADPSLSDLLPHEFWHYASPEVLLELCDEVYIARNRVIILSRRLNYEHRDWKPPFMPISHVAFSSTKYCSMRAVLRELGCHISQAPHNIEVSTIIAYKPKLQTILAGKVPALPTTDRGVASVVTLSGKRECKGVLGETVGSMLALLDAAPGARFIVIGYELAADI